MNWRLQSLLLATMVVFLLAGCRGGEELDNRLLQLSLVYSIEGPKSGTMDGTTGAATGGAEVECRMAEGEKLLIGSTTANERGAFLMDLDASFFPPRLPGSDDFQLLNETVECRPAGGAWSHPLKPAKIEIE